MANKGPAKSFKSSANIDRSIISIVETLKKPQSKKVEKPDPLMMVLDQILFQLKTQEEKGSPVNLFLAITKAYEIALGVGNDKIFKNAFRELSKSFISLNETHHHVLAFDDFIVQKVKSQFSLIDKERDVSLNLPTLYYRDNCHSQSIKSSSSRSTMSFDRDLSDILSPSSGSAVSFDRFSRDPSDVLSQSSRSSVSLDRSLDSSISYFALDDLSSGPTFTPVQNTKLRPRVRPEFLERVRCLEKARNLSAQKPKLF